MDIILIFVFAVICAGLVEGTCPSTCSCVDYSSGSHVNCNSKYLGRIPTLPKDTYYLDLSGNPLNCDCSIFAFWSWLIERSSIYNIGSSATCSNGTLVKSLQSAALDICHPDNCQCFNGGKCVAMGYELICDCIGQWTGTFCQESQCTSYDCGFGDCYIEPVNGTAQCLCGDRYVNYCPEQEKSPQQIQEQNEWLRSIP
ncbi:unnamed protein product [Mytilus edulis]|uniref:EGF-like domain-containing protein n=1 Tax=Mytilus edulis TaxID=6550 RepID=A0A8S3SZU6_MYTED|nr:unnamed protein product [Mytilus edulis]